MESSALHLSSRSTSSFGRRRRWMSSARERARYSPPRQSSLPFSADARSPHQGTLGSLLSASRRWPHHSRPPLMCSLPSPRIDFHAARRRPVARGTGRAGARSTPQARVLAGRLLRLEPRHHRASVHRVSRSDGGRTGRGYAVAVETRPMKTMSIKPAPVPPPPPDLGNPETRGGGSRGK